MVSPGHNVFKLHDVDIIHRLCCQHENISWNEIAHSATPCIKSVTYFKDSRQQRVGKAKKDVVRMCKEWCRSMWPLWRWPEIWKRMGAGARRCLGLLTHRMEHRQHPNLSTDMNGWIHNFLTNIARQTLAIVPILPINTCGVVLTWLWRAFIDVDWTSVSNESRTAITRKSIQQIRTSGTVLTGF